MWILRITIRRFVCHHGGFCAGSVYTAEKGMTYSNKIWVKSDILAPVAIEFDQAGSLRLPMGRRFRAGWTYAISDGVAVACKGAAQERPGATGTAIRNAISRLNLPQLTAQQAYGYAALFRPWCSKKGDRVLRATFYQPARRFPMPMGAGAGRRTLAWPENPGRKAGLGQKPACGLPFAKGRSNFFCFGGLTKIGKLIIIKMRLVLNLRKG